MNIISVFCSKIAIKHTINQSSIITSLENNREREQWSRQNTVESKHRNENDGVQWRTHKKEYGCMQTLKDITGKSF